MRLSARGRGHVGTPVLIALVTGLLLMACSGQVVAPSPVPPTPGPTPTAVMPVPASPSPSVPVATATPSPSPSAASPSPTATPVAAWPEFETELLALQLRSSGRGFVADETGDALGPVGQPRPIAPDLDLIRVYASWAQVGASPFDLGGLFDCRDPEVFCGPQPHDLAGLDLVVAAIETGGHITFGGNRGGQLAVAYDRQAQPDAPLLLGPVNYAGADLVVIADLQTESLFTIGWTGDEWARTASPGRVRIVGSTAVFLMPLTREEDLAVAFFSSEHYWRCRRDNGGEVECQPPANPRDGAIDAAPGNRTSISSMLAVGDDLGPAAP